MKKREENIFLSAGRCAFFSILFVAGTVFLDQYTKLLSAAHLKGKEAVSLIPGILELKYLYPENRGIAFGMFQGSTTFFAVVSMILFALIIWVFIKIPKKRYYIPLMAVCALMLSGALGNMIDRVFRGYVIDFIYISLIDFPVFNMADIYVVCGGILLVILVFFKYKKDDDFDFLSFRKKEK